MPILGKDIKPEIEILKGMELLRMECIRDMIEIYKRGNVADWKSIWRLWKARLSPESPEILILDTTHFISKGYSNYVLVPIHNKERIKTWLIGVPEDIKDKLKGIVKKHGLFEKFLAESLTRILMEPIPRLKNPKVIADMKKEDWDNFIESNISPGAEKDHRMNLIFKMHLLRGGYTKIQPTYLADNKFWNWKINLL